MKKFALAGNPNCGKTTLFNTLTGSTAYVGNWPGVTVDKKEGTYKKCAEPINIVDLPGIYSLSPYTPEEVISRTFILDEQPDCIINIVDATNLERNLYLTTQLMEIDVPMVIALNMMDVLNKNGDKIDIKALEKAIGVPVVKISALKEENIDELMNVAYEESKKPRVGKTVLEGSELKHLIHDVEIAFKAAKVKDPLFHAIKLCEMDEIETKQHPDLITIVDSFKATFKNDVFGTDFEAFVASDRYQYISKNFAVTLTKAEKVSKAKNGDIKAHLTQSDKIDKVLTNRFAGIPIFLFILFAIFHLTFSENLFYLGGLFESVAPSFEGSIYDGLIWTEGGINSPGVILANLLNCSTDAISGYVVGLLEGANAQEWLVGLIGDGILGGLFAVLSFVPQILCLFLFFSILEDSGYMARVAFILDRIFRKFGLSGRAFMPMIMGFGCSVPAMINTRTLADQNERTATIRVIPFFSCGAKLPILTAIAGGIIMQFGVGSADLITFSMYVLGMVVAILSVLLMRNTVMKGEIPPFIMELPAYHWPKFKSLMIHLWDKLKHFVKKAFTIILASTIVIWFLTNFGWDWAYIGAEGMNESILASLGKLIQPLFTPLGFGSQLTAFGWVFAVAAITGLIAKENVISTFYTLACCIIVALQAATTPELLNILNSLDPEIVAALLEAGEQTEDGISETLIMIQATGITVPGLIAFIAFNMLTIPCFAACATAKAELPKGKFATTILFWVAASFIVGSMVFVALTWVWTSIIFVIAIIALFVFLYYRNKKIRKAA